VMGAGITKAERSRWQRGASPTSAGLSAVEAYFLWGALVGAATGGRVQLDTVSSSLLVDRVREASHAQRTSVNLVSLSWSAPLPMTAMSQEW
jgi:hypothetical protein